MPQECEATLNPAQHFRGILLKIKIHFIADV
jgi:hypothetical protein